jgi:hypothetical protein
MSRVQPVTGLTIIRTVLTCLFSIYKNFVNKSVAEERVIHIACRFVYNVSVRRVLP